MSHFRSVTGVIDRCSPESWSAGFRYRAFRLALVLHVLIGACAASVLVAQRPGSVPTAETSLLVSVKSFGAKGDGKTDDRLAIVTAMLSGHAVFFPKGTYVVGAPIDFGELKASKGIEVPNVVLVGEGPTMSRILFKGAGTLLTGGRTAPKREGYNQALNIRRLTLMGDPDGKPKQNIRFGRFVTTPNEFAGTGSTQTGIYWEFSAPSVVEESEFREFSTALRTKFGYGITLRNNVFHYNNLALELSGAVTSVTLESNLIERNAVGAGLWIASQIRFRDNIFQGNYAGADIVSYNWNSQIFFENNYFEASPNGFWHAGDSEGQFISSNYYFRNNKGLDVKIGPLADRFSFQENLLTGFSVDQSATCIRVIANTDNEADGKRPFIRYTGDGAGGLISRPNGCG